jgi:hypothetical protein
MTWTYLESPKRQSTITQHDIRLAILFERRFRERDAGQSMLDVDQSKDGDSLRTKRARFRPLTLSKFNEKLQLHKSTPKQPTQVDSPSVRTDFQAPMQSSKASTSRTCPSCGGQHDLADCLEPRNFPPTPCMYCGGHHLTTDCPEKKLGRKTKRGTCSACRGPHSIEECPVRMRYQPPTPCELCKEMHWQVDCPQLKCALCGGRHLTNRCLTLSTMPQVIIAPVKHRGASGDRDTENRKKLRSPCGICRGNHWVTDCPHRLEYFESGRPTA